MIFGDKIMLNRKVNSDDKCYNCHKLGYFGRHCFFQNKRLNKNTHQFQREKSQKSNLHIGENSVGQSR